MLPAFPRTPHLPHLPNVEENDVVASEKDAEKVFSIPTSRIHIEEKIDGASVGFTLHDGYPVIRNRDHILGKGFLRKQIDTTAKMQFRSIWSWFYKNKDKFKAICDNQPFSVYGEWMVAQHGIFYDKLPDWFVAYDIYNYESEKFLAPQTARRLLERAGFVCPECLSGDVENYDDLVKLANGQSKWSNDKREGIYLKIDNSEIVTHRFKMVREDFQRGALWNNTEMIKNELLEKSLAANV